MSQPNDFTPPANQIPLTDNQVQPQLQQGQYVPQPQQQPYTPQPAASYAQPQPQFQQAQFQQAPYGAQPYPQNGYPNASTGLKSRLVAGLLGIFLGGLGIHRFYLGFTSIGVAQIIVSIFTLGIGSLWGFIEGIMILAKSASFMYDAQGRPLAD